MRIHFAALFLILVSTLSAQTTTPNSAMALWVVTWAASPFEGDSWHEVPTLVDSTLREVVHTSVAGSEFRVVFTNEFGTEALRVGAASVSLSTGESSIDTASLHALSFDGSPSIV